ncbi:MAG: hypothetical protein WA942_16370 [Mycolicibacter sinensis]
MFAGMRGLLLHTVGAKSGAPRVTPHLSLGFRAPVVCHRRGRRKPESACLGT